MRHLELLNAVLALAFRQPDVTPCLTDNGYLLQAIGVTIRLTDDANTQVVPDILASRLDPDTTLMIEVKGGKAFNHEQLGRSLRVGPRDLRDAAHLPVRNVDEHVVHVAIVCNESERPDFAVAAAGRPVSILGFDGERFRMSGETLPDPDLAACLHATGFGQFEPLAVVPFDVESPDEEIVSAVMPEIVDLLLAGVGTFLTDTLLQKTHHLVHPVMQATGSGSEYGGLQRKTRNVVDRLVAEALGAWVERIPAHPGWRFKGTLPADGRTRELQKIRRATQRFLGDPATQGVQLRIDELMPDSDPGDGDT